MLLMILLLAALLAPLHSWNEDCYTGCAEGLYGCKCDQRCVCASAFQDCDDSPTGSGRCICHYGQWERCGEPNPMAAAVDFADGDDAPSAAFSCAGILEILKVDNSSLSRRPREVHRGMAVHVMPQGLKRPLLVAYDAGKFAELGVADEAVRAPRFVKALAGNVLFKGSHPFANNYGGHQFGIWAGQLGDGRAVQLGVIGSRKGELGISLKGSGRTPFSRAGDGRATLVSALREFLGSVYLEAVGIPVVSALAVVSSCEDQMVIRDPFYDNRPRNFIPAVLVRASPSWLRFGSIQIAAQRMGVAQVVRLAKEAIRVMGRPTCGNLDFAQPVHCSGDTGGDTLACLLEQNVVRLAALVAVWMSHGFAHGVMNTDNMSLIGITIDLNVFGWISKWRDDFTPNFIDTERRYRFGNQKNMALWNLRRLADALVGEYSHAAVASERTSSTKRPTHAAADKEKWLDRSIAEEILARFDGLYHRCFNLQMSERLGLDSSESADREFLIAEFITTARHIDYFTLSRSIVSLSQHSNGTLAAWAKSVTAIDHPDDGNGGQSLEARLRYMGSLLLSAIAEKPREEWAARVEAAVPKVFFRSSWISRVLEQITDPAGPHFKSCNFSHPDFTRILNALRQPFSSAAAEVRELVVRGGSNSDADFESTCGAQ